MNKLYLALVHYPVLNKAGETVMSSVTNLDIHDIARSAKTYNVASYYIVTPDNSQKEYIDKVLAFWQTEKARLFNAHRNAALSLLQVKDSIESVKEHITMLEGMPPVVITTTANTMSGQINFEMFYELNLHLQPVLLIFGTGNGLTAEVHQNADYILRPITGLSDYNHLSVRSAVAIVLDRIASAVYKGRN